MEGEPIPTSETPSPGTPEAEGQDLLEQPRPEAIPTSPVMGWVADFVLTFGFACCAAVAVGWVNPPFAPAFKSPSVSAIEAASASGGVVVSDARLGTWTAPYSGNAKWSRTAKIASAGVHGVRVILTVDFAATPTDVVPGVLGEYSATVLMHQDGKGQAHEGGCQLQLEWLEGNALQIRQKGPCGEPGNIAPDGTFTASYDKVASSSGHATPAATPATANCAKIKDAETRLFCKDPALRVAREIAAAVYGDSAAVVRQTSPEIAPEFEQNDKHWQAEVRRVCLAAEGSQDDPEAGKAVCFSQSYDARVNWLRLHTGLVHLALAAAKDEAAGERYSDALSEYADTYGALALQLPVLERRLRPILPTKDSEALAVAMTHRGPRTGLFQAGCGPQGCDAHEGAFEIDARSNTVALALRQGPKITVYSLEGQSADLPKRLHDWLEQRSGHVSEIVYKP